MRIPGVTYVQGRNSYTDRDGAKYGIAIHNTSNTASAANEALYATRRTDQVSAHLYVDDRTVIQSIDLLARTGHAGSGNGNENAVSVEITGLNSWSRDRWLNSVAWDQLGSALRWVCGQFNTAVRRASVAEMVANPKVRAFYSHDDMRRAWGGTDHTDPGPNFPWDRLFSAVGGAAPPVTAQGGSGMSNFMMQVNGDPTIYLSSGFEYRELSNWDDFLLYRDTFKWPYVVVPDTATFGRRAGRYYTADEAVAAPALLTDEQMQRIELAAKTGAAAGGSIPADVLREIMDEESVSMQELRDAAAAAASGEQKA